MPLLRLVTAAFIAALCAVAHSADFALAAGRVGAQDVPALAQFYQTAFGMKEVNRLQMGKSMEIMLNFGDTIEAAKANTAAKAVVAAGGRITTEPVAVGKSGAWIAMGMDTVGNRFEMVQRAPPAR